MNLPLRSLVQTLFFLLLASPAMSQTPQAFALQVEHGVSALPLEDTHQTESGKWRKSRLTLTGVRYDVKRTDSALVPLVGSVSAEITDFTSDDFDDVTQAERAEARKPNMKWIVNLNYHPNKSLKRWTFASGTSQMYWVGGDGKAMGGPSEITREEFGGPGVTVELAALIESTKVPGQAPKSAKAK